MTMLQTLAVLRDNTPMPLPQVDLGKVPDASAAGPLANYFGVSTPTIMAVATALDGDMQRTAKIVADALAPISKPRLTWSRWGSTTFVKRASLPRSTLHSFP